MARGWESKSVEAQIEAAETKTTGSTHRTEPAQLELLRKKENLQLSLTRVRRELESSANPRYRVVLNKALTDLQEQLSNLEGETRAAAAASST